VTVGSEKYHIIFIDEGKAPTQKLRRVFEEEREAYRAAMRSAKFETHCLGVVRRVSNRPVSGRR